MGFEEIIRVDIETNAPGVLGDIAGSLEKTGQAIVQLVDATTGADGAFGAFIDELARTNDVAASMQNGFDTTVLVVDELGNVIREVTVAFDAFGNAVTTGTLELDGFGEASLSVAASQRALADSWVAEESAMTGLETNVRSLISDAGVYEAALNSIADAQAGVTAGMNEAAGAATLDAEAVAKAAAENARLAAMLGTIDEQIAAFAADTAQAAPNVEAVAVAEESMSVQLQALIPKMLEFGLNLEKMAKTGIAPLETLQALLANLDEGMTTVAAASKAAADGFSLTAKSAAELAVSAPAAATGLQTAGEAALAATASLKAAAEAAAAVAPALASDVPAMMNVATAEEVIATNIGITNAQIASATEILQVLGSVEGEAAVQALNFAEAELKSASAIFDADSATSAQVAAYESLGAAVSQAKANVLALADAELAASEESSVLSSGITSTKEAAASATVSMEELALAEKEAAGAGAGGEGGGFGMSSFLIFTLGMMALGAARQFMTMALDADHALTIIQARTGASNEQMQTWTSTIEALGAKYGFTLGQMAAGLDLVTRAQFQAADATTVLDSATQLANANGANLVDTTNLLVTSLKAYGAGANQAEMYAGALNNTLKNSRLSVSELTDLLGNSITIAAGLGISITDLGDAVAIFSQSTASGIIATRDFQSMLAGLQNFAALSGTQIAKLAGSFDIAKFSAANFTEKLALLAAASDGSEQTFTKLVGGAQNAKTAMDHLDISTKQLAINAANLGVAFDPVRYNALDAAGKLLYLMTIVGDSGPKFAQLTDGTKKTNAALADLSTALDKGGQQAVAMSSHFDMAAFKSDDLAQKLHDLADFLGGPSSAAFIKAIGGAQNLQEALRIMGTEADKHHEVKVDTSTAHGHINALSDDTKKLVDKLTNKEVMKVDTTEAQQHQRDLQRQIDITANDTSTKVAQMQASWSKLGDSLLNTIKPALDGVIKAVTSAMDFISSNVLGNLGGQWGRDLIIDLTIANQKMTDYIRGGFKDSMAAAMVDAVKGWGKSVQQGGQDFMIQLTILNQKVTDYIRGGFKDSTISAFNSWRQGIDQTFRQWSTDTINTINNWRLSVDQSFRQWSTGTINTVNKWRLDLDQSFRQGATNTLNTINTWRLNVDQSFRQGATDWLNTVNKVRLDIDQSFRQGATDWGNTIKKGLDNILKWFQDLSQNLVGGSVVPDMVNLITQTFTQGATDWLTPITTFVNSAENTFNTALAVIPAIATSIGAGVNSAFVTAGANWNATVGAAMSTVVATVQSWVGAAMSAGAAVGNAIGNGLQSAVGWVTQAASNLAGAIASVLPHSPAESGPLMHLDTFMPGMIDTLVSTMNANAYKLKVPSLQLASTISMPVQGLSTTVPASFAAQGGATTDMTPVVQVLVQIYQVLRSQQAQGTSTGGMQGGFHNTPTQQEIVRAIYNALNVYGGKTYESGGRGAFAGLGV